MSFLLFCLRYLALRGAETSSCDINGISGRISIFLNRFYLGSYAKYQLSVKKIFLNDFRQKLLATPIFSEITLNAKATLNFAGWQNLNGTYIFIIDPRLKVDCSFRIKQLKSFLEKLSLVLQVLS